MRMMLIPVWACLVVFVGIPLAIVDSVIHPILNSIRNLEKYIDG